MLQAIREKAQGWIAWVIVILISVPFALWGIQEYLGIGGEPKVVKVNDREISERELDSAFQQFRARLRDQLGASYRAGLLDDRLLKQQVLSGMIQQELLAQAAQNQGMNASDAMVQREIASVPVYQKAGRFDYETYQNALRQQGMSSDYLAQRVRAELVMDQLTRSIEQSEFTTSRELEQSQRLREQQREFAYLLFAKDKYLDDQPLAQADIEAYYNSHAADFRAPEQVKLEYVSLSLEDLAKQVKYTDADLQSYLDSHRQEFVLAEERRVSHILIVAEEGKDAEAQQKAAGLLEQIQQGADFAELAKQHSQDPGSAPQGGDLGFFGRGVMDPAFEEAAFQLKPEQVSDLVRSQFGYHILKLQEMRGTASADLAAVRDRVIAAYTREQARQQFDEQYDRLSTLAYETPDSLEPVQEQLGLKIHTSDWIGRQGGEGILASPKVVAAAFSEDVLNRGNNSEALELEAEQLLVLRVVGHEPVRTKPLEQVRSEVEQALRQQQLIQAAAAAGTQALEQLRAGKSLAEVAQETGATLETPGLIDRFDAKLPLQIRNEVYRLPKPEADKVSYGGVELSNGDYALMALTRVVDGQLAGAKDAGSAQDTGSDIASLRQGLDRSRGGLSFDLYLGALEQAAEIEYLNKQATGVESREE
ncbi:MAG: SurA N-terminal domain-containing protein [Gammaproteobacteria bacterium]|nr:SurA N-terminal domain-containing protein [Gammaproteobacteria bacterium]